MNIIIGISAILAAYFTLVVVVNMLLIWEKKGNMILPKDYKFILDHFAPKISMMIVSGGVFITLLLIKIFGG